MIYVCTNCGNNQFTQRRYVTAEATVEVFDFGIEVIHLETNDEGEPDHKLHCDDCGFEIDPEIGDWNENLITEEEYERREVALLSWVNHDA